MGVNAIRAVRGAITVENDNPDEIKNAVVLMLTEIVKSNEIVADEIISAEFSITDDIKSAVPAKFARTELGWTDVPFMCFREFEFKGSLKRALRVILYFNSEKPRSLIKHVYLRDAKILRPDLNQK